MKIYTYLKDKLQEHLSLFIIIYGITLILIILSMTLLYLDHQEYIKTIDFINHHDLLEIN